MAIPYLNIARAVMLRANQIGDAADAAALETLFASSLATSVAGMEVPLTALKLTILAVEKRWVERVSKCGLPHYIQALTGRSADLATGSQIPTVDNAAREFQGSLSSIRDSINGRPLTEMPLAMVLSRYPRPQRNMVIPVYWYHRLGRILHHTRASGAYVEGCSWSYSTQAAAYAVGDSPLPGPLEVGFVAEVLENLPQENWFVSEAGHYTNIRREVEESLATGVEPTATLPDSTLSADPIKD